jgi:hypothetical protein
VHCANLSANGVLHTNGEHCSGNFLCKNKRMQAARTSRQFLRAPGSRIVMLVLRDKRSIIVNRTKTTVLTYFTAA